MLTSETYWDQRSSSQGVIQNVKYEAKKPVAALAARRRHVDLGAQLKLGIRKAEIKTHHPGPLLLAREEGVVFECTNGGSG